MSGFTDTYLGVAGMNLEYVLNWRQILLIQPPIFYHWRGDININYTFVSQKESVQKFWQFIIWYFCYRFLRFRSLALYNNDVYVTILFTICKRTRCIITIRWIQSIWSFCHTASLSVFWSIFVYFWCYLTTLSPCYQPKNDIHWMHFQARSRAQLWSQTVSLLH